MIGYILYTLDPATAVNLGTGRLGMTIPFVLYGVFRYFYLVHQKGEGGNPSRLVLSDRPLLLNLLLYGATVILILYVWP